MRHLSVFCVLILSLAPPLCAQDDSIQIQVENRTGYSIRAIYCQENLSDEPKLGPNLLAGPIPEGDSVLVTFCLSDMEKLTVVLQNGRQFVFDEVDLESIKAKYQNLVLLWDKAHNQLKLEHLE